MTVISNPISIHRYMGLSTDTKPTVAAPLGLAPPTKASTFYEYDTGALYITYDGTNWVPKDAGSKRSWTFGKPLLRSRDKAAIRWNKSYTSLFHRGGTGYQVKMSGGVQSGDDWASFYVPVNELPVTEFNSALWSYYLYEVTHRPYGVNLVIWVHDPTDLDKRAEITQGASVAGLAKERLLNAHRLDTTVDQFFWYGENITSDIASGTSELHSWDDFQADAEFSTYTIYRISLEWGWLNDEVDLGDAYLVELILNGEVILLEPQEARIDGIPAMGMTIERKTSPGTNFCEGPCKVYFLMASRNWGSGGVAHAKITDAIDGTSGRMMDLCASENSLPILLNPPWQCNVGLRYAASSSGQCQVHAGFIPD